MTNPVSADKRLLADVRYLIDTARKRVAGAVSLPSIEQIEAELSLDSGHDV